MKLCRIIIITIFTRAFWPHTLQSWSHFFSSSSFSEKSCGLNTPAGFLSNKCVWFFPPEDTATAFILTFNFHDLFCTGNNINVDLHESIQNNHIATGDDLHRWKHNQVCLEKFTRTCICVFLNVVFENQGFRVNPCVHAMKGKFCEDQRRLQGY